MTDPTSPRGKQAVEVTCEGVTYVVDLDPDEVAELDAALAPFIAKARRLEMDPGHWV
jgi:hypothetical protein